MKTGAVIFARMSSSRLPGKSLIDLQGRTLIGRIIDRTRKINTIDSVILATSDESTDNVLAEYAKAEGIGVFRGALNDVAGRALACAEAFDLDRFVRVCGDRPFMDPRLVDQMLEMQVKTECDLITNMAPKSFPPGLTVEVLMTDALKRVLNKTRNFEDREHVTRFIYSHPEKFSIENLSSISYFDERVSLVIDTQEDLDRARYIMSRLNHPIENASLTEIVRLAGEWYDLNEDLVKVL